MKQIAKVDFFKCIQDSQDLGSDNEHVKSRVFFRVTIDGKSKDFFADIIQAYGSSFSYEDDPIEVSNPFIDDLPFNFGDFRDEAEKYYRMCVGGSAMGIRITGGQNIRMRNNTFQFPYSTSVETTVSSGAW